MSFPVLVKRFTNRAYGFPRGSARRVTPVALVCIHITGNRRTASDNNPRAAAMDEFNFANRAGGDGPSAHYYIARDGFAIDALDPRFAAWSNGDVSQPNIANPGIRKVLALRARGFNANEGYWLEIECVGHPTGFRITDAQVETMAAIIRERSQKSGLPINRETVHGHWEINGVDRRLCPDRDHEGFLNRVIAAAKNETPSEDSDVRFINGASIEVTTDKLLPVKAGSSWRTFDGKVAGTFSKDALIPVLGRADSANGQYAVYIGTGDTDLYPDGEERPSIVLVQSNVSLADLVAAPAAPPAPAPDCNAEVAAAIVADRKKARVVWS